MEFKDFAQTEASAFLERLTSAAQAATQKVREDYEAQLAGMREQADSLREQIQEQVARAASLEADLDTVIDAHKTVDNERRMLEEELRSAREFLEKAREEIAAARRGARDRDGGEGRSRSGTLGESGGRGRARQRARTLETLRGEQTAREETIRQLQARLADVEAAEASLRKTSGDTNSLLHTLTSAAEAATKKIREESDAEVAALRKRPRGRQTRRRRGARRRERRPGAHSPRSGTAGRGRPGRRRAVEGRERRRSLCVGRPSARAGVSACRSLPHEGQASRGRARRRC